MKLDKVVPWGRSFDEYRRMFDLSDADLNLKILGCGDGPASFNAEMTGQGRQVISVDPLYVCSKEEIQQRVDNGYAHIISQLEAEPELYNWEYFRDPQDLAAARLKATAKFFDDFDAGLAAKRYQAQEMPRLDFPDQHFQLSLTSHFLFLYTEQLSLDFHVEAVDELLRVSQEVRIFPLLDLECKRSPYVGFLWTHFSGKGVTVEVRNVPYEFQQGGNQMMRLHRNGGIVTA